MELKGGNNIMYTFTIVVLIVNVYILLLPPFIYYSVFKKEGVKVKGYYTVIYTAKKWILGAV